jgi:hypothetical protein
VKYRVFILSLLFLWLTATLSADNPKIYVANYIGGVQIFDTTVDTFHIARDFGTDNIELRIFADPAESLTLEVTADRTDIITVGSYDTDLTYAEYHDTIVNIPIESIVGQYGQTILTVRLTYGTRTVTRTVYVSVY